MSTATNKPLRGPKYRSRAFQEYLLAQSPERVAEIVRGESSYNDMRDDPGSLAAASERDHAELMLAPVEGQKVPEDGA